MVATQSVSHLAWPKMIFCVRVGGQFFRHYFCFLPFQIVTAKVLPPYMFPRSYERICVFMAKRIHFLIGHVVAIFLTIFCRTVPIFYTSFGHFLSDRFTDQMRLSGFANVKKVKKLLKNWMFSAFISKTATSQSFWR